MPVNNNRVGIIIDRYLKYPSYPYGSNEKLLIVLERLLAQLGLDGGNPFGGLIKPEQTVVIKPNWVIDKSPKNTNVDSLITHTSIVKFAVDKAIMAMDGRGVVVIADAPVQGCDFEKLVEKARVRELIDLYKAKYPKINLSVVDLRKTVFSYKGQSRSGGDPMGYTLVDLGNQSLLADLVDNCDGYRVTMYNHKMMKQHHNRVKNEYLVSNTLLGADLVINLPKMKCHIKAGLTGALKNLVGINGHKEFLPHHIAGSFFEGGDQYIYKNVIKDWYNFFYDRYWSGEINGGIVSRARMAVINIMGELAKAFGDSLLEGGWFGNQTIPRTTIDLNNILYFYDSKKKKLSDTPVRKVVTIVDGVVAGEGNGPLSPTDRHDGVLLAGFNPLLIDMVMGHIMGYSVLRLNTIFLGWRHRLSRFGGEYDIDGLLKDLPNLKFAKPKYWQLLNR